MHGALLPLAIYAGADPGGFSMGSKDLLPKLYWGSQKSGNYIGIKTRIIS